MKTFKYEVAFSFLSQDEDLVHKIDSRLEGRHGDTFIYSKFQERLAGTDGPDAFARVFDDEARTVVVVFSPGWGAGGMTVPEMTAIQNRGLREGWDFLLVVVVDTAEGMPKFIPRNHIWYGLKRFGIDKIDAVIDTHVGRNGGESKEPTFQARAESKQRELDLQKARLTFRSPGGTGMPWANSVLPGMFTQLRTSPETNPLLRLDAGPAMRLRAPGVSLDVYWTGRYTNSLEGAKLVAVYHDQRLSRGGSFDDRPVLKERIYIPDLGPDGQPCWRTKDNRYLASDRVVDRILQDMLEHMTHD